jgi:hypothetical protein
LGERVRVIGASLRVFHSDVLVLSSTIFVIPGLGAQYLLSEAERVTSGLQVEVLTSALARRYPDQVRV